jgi:hypothetical protein
MRIRLPTIFCLVNLVLSTYAYGQSPVKHALIIANGNYDKIKSKGWGKLSSLNDVPLITNALQKQRFENQNIITIIDATAEQMLAGFRSLKAKLKPGDIVVIHYSGHGVQLADDNGDEPDGLDEALVPIDAVYDIKASGKYLRDDYLGVIFSEIRLILGQKGHLLVFLDSCHSGSASRGNAVARGDLKPLISQKTSSKPEVGAGQSLADQPIKTRTLSSSDLARFVVFSGSSSNESNYEAAVDGQTYGSLSYSVSKVLNQLDSKDTYRHVFARVRSEMAAIGQRQTPVLEGDVDYRFFNGDLVKQEPYIEIKKLLPNNAVELSNGLTGGVNIGDIFVLDIAGNSFNKDKSHLLTGKITSSGHFSSVLTMDQPLPSGFSATKYWAYCTQHSFPNALLSVFVKRAIGNRALMDSLKVWKFVHLENDEAKADVFLAPDESGNSCVLEVADSGLPFLDMAPVDLRTTGGIGDMKKAMLAFTQARFIKKLNLVSRQIKLELSLVRVKIKLNSNGDTVIEKIWDEPLDTLNRKFSTNDKFVLKIKNSGTARAFYNIICIQPDHKIVPVVPATANVDMNSFIVEPGQEIILQTPILDGFFKPYGVEMLKLFATPTPENLFPIIEAQDGITKRGDGSPLDNLIEQQRKRGTVVRAPQETGATFDYVYTIIPPVN